VASSARGRAQVLQLLRNARACIESNEQLTAAAASGEFAQAMQLLVEAKELAAST
jgi:hypothetical protein